jgi:flavin-dependent dehydrogenase
VSHDGSRHVVYWFEDAFAPVIPHAYQVRRDEFDAALLANARAKGADVLEGWHAGAPRWEGKRLVGLVVREPGGGERVIRCRAFLVAAVSHFKGVWLPPEREAGNITIVLADGGWFWLIPFADDTVSVGAVLDVEKWRASGGTPESLFSAAVQATPEVARRLEHAERLIPFSAVQNFSYRVMQIGGDGYCLIGDAAGFLDPIFSTGVFISTTTAASAAQDIIESLMRHGRVDASDLGPTISLTRSLHRLFFSFIRAYYDRHFLAFFFSPTDASRLTAAIVSLLAADVVRPGRWKKTIRFRALQGLARVQQVGARLGRPIVEPLAAGPTSGS